jgi:hypothetical protein
MRQCSNQAGGSVTKHNEIDHAQPQRIDDENDSNYENWASTHQHVTNLKQGVWLVRQCILDGQEYLTWVNGHDDDEDVEHNS